MSPLCSGCMLSFFSKWVGQTSLEDDYLHLFKLELRHYINADTDTKTRVAELNIICVLIINAKTMGDVWKSVKTITIQTIAVVVLYNQSDEF